MTDTEPTLCAHCGRPITQTLPTPMGIFWVHEDRNVACDMNQRSYPPRGTNAAPAP